MNSTTIKKYSKKTLPQLKELAQTHFNKFIRLRDTDDYGYGRCISCNKSMNIPSPDSHAGHLFPKTHSRLRFDEDNVNLQCKQCNYFKHSNGPNYMIGLEAKIGGLRLVGLKFRSRDKHPHKWDRFTLIDIIETYKAECKELAKTKMFKI